MTEWVPVCDIAEHQGLVDFKVMRAKGVRGLILRVAHGLKLDARVEQYYSQALDEGFEPADIGWYSFLNPKRGSGADTALFAVEAILRITGRPDFLHMLDVENYRDQTPNKGQAPVFGAAFADYIREHIATVKALTPRSRVIGYTNRAYWNGKVAGTTEQWVGDDELAAELDWIVARYPAYSEVAYANKPLPPDTSGWGEWAFKAAPDGPFPPRGASWKAWQFSAGFNRQGQAYGVSSSDLDLNIVHPDAWARWTGAAVFPPPVPPIPNPQGDLDMPLRITNDAEHDGNPAGTQHWVLMDDGGKREIDLVEQAVRGNTIPERVGNSQLDATPDWVRGDGTVDQVARDEAAHANEAVTRIGNTLSDIRMGGQRIADAGGH